MRTFKKKSGSHILDITKPGSTTATIRYGPKSKDFPRGGTLNRLEQILLVRNETWDSVIGRLLDFWDDNHAPEQRSYKE